MSTASGKSATLQSNRACRCRSIPARPGLFEVALDEVGNPPHHAALFGWADLGPHAVVEGASRGGDRAIDIGLLGCRHIGDDRSGRRVDHLEGLPGNGTDHIAVNQHLGRAAEKRRRVPQSRIEFERIHRFPPLPPGRRRLPGAARRVNIVIFGNI
jgi:hypothetical protein